MTGVNWYAPSLTSRLEAGSGELEINEITELFTSGITKRAVASGHMATVIRQSLQFILPEDIRAIAIYLKSIGRENSDIASHTNFFALSDPNNNNYKLMLKYLIIFLKKLENLPNPNLFLSYLIFQKHKQEKS